VSKSIKEQLQERAFKIAQIAAVLQGYYPEREEGTPIETVVFDAQRLLKTAEDAVAKERGEFR
jgi:hypothetical protein